MNSADIQIIKPGTVHIEYGPVSAVISAFRGTTALTDECIQSVNRIKELLQELSLNMKLLRTPLAALAADELPSLPGRMIQAVSLTGDGTMTPLAAVAGTLSDLTADWLIGEGATRVTVNNGGDIAVRLKENKNLRIGVSRSLYQGAMEILEIEAGDGIGGVATSGLGGRSLTRGIADSVTVAAESCRTADAFATYLANSTFVSCPEVATAVAEELEPGTDIPGLRVVRRVGRLRDSVVSQAFDQLSRAAEEALKNNHIRKVYASIQGRKIELTA